jgi:acetylornithine deacetylase
MAAAFPADTVELLQELVAFDTVNANISGKTAPEQPLLERLDAGCTALGMQTRRIDVPTGGQNLLCTRTFDPAAPWLVFESHMDTVAVAGMSVPPFAGAVRDGRIWGRGTCDTKGTGAAMIGALQRYLAEDSHPHNIALAFTVDEEFGMTGVRALAAAWPDLGIDAVGVIVGEPTMLQPVIAHNGDIRWRVTTRGIAVHSSDPSRGRSAISDMLHLISAIENDYIPGLTAAYEFTGTAQASVNTVTGGTALNIIPDHCEIGVDRRLVPGEATADADAAFRAFVAAAAADRPGTEFVIDTIFSAPPLLPRSDCPLRPRVKAALAATGHATDAGGAGYATDAGDLSAAGIPTIVIGPGDIAQAHTHDEWLALDQLAAGIDVYHAIMRTSG